MRRDLGFHIRLVVFIHIGVPLPFVCLQYNVCQHHLHSRQVMHDEV